MLIRPEMYAHGEPTLGTYYIASEQQSIFLDQYEIYLRFPVFKNLSLQILSHSLVMRSFKVGSLRVYTSGRTCCCFRPYATVTIL